MQWLHKRLPTRESIARNRWLSPVAGRLMHPSLWRFNRRSVPRGVALGLAAGLVVPFAHTLIAAVVAVPARANFVVAAATTWVSNPITWLIIFPLERDIGRFVIGLAHAASIASPVAPGGAAMTGLFGSVLATSGEIGIGSLILAPTAALAGYVLTAWIWRARVARKWRKRAHG